MTNEISLIPKPSLILTFY